MISGAQGNLILMTSSGVLIGERTVEPLDSQTTKTEQFNLQDWPTGDEVSLVVTWEVSRQVLTADEIFISSATQTEEESSEVTDFIPGILGGIALAAAVILVVRIINSRQDQGSKPEKKKTKPSDEPKPALSDVKIQIGCPECSRQLRVPANYSGSVRCPDCNHNFDVEEEQEEVEEEQEEFENETVENIVEDQVEQEQEQEQEMNDGKTEVACPECSQTLRIPSSYSGSVRCPACKNIFRT